jgi:hypothetical protein
MYSTLSLFRIDTCTARTHSHVCAVRAGTQTSQARTPRARDYDIIGNFFERLIDHLIYELYLPEVFAHTRLCASQGFTRLHLTYYRTR